MKSSFNVSREINEKIAEDINFCEFVFKSIKRHFANDWSECYPEDQLSNQQALENGSRIFSVYNFNKNEKVWIITEAEPHRDITTVLFPHEY